MTEERSFAHSEEMFARASKLTPLATQTFSKSWMAFGRYGSPLFLERGKGSRVWDPDGNEYIDYVLGLLPIILGYGDPDVDDAIRHQLSKGISFSLATDLEAELAEEMIRLIPCAEMVRFGKNGSDATTAAVRVARAQTGRDHVVVCGYHGWHDWYISSTVRNKGVPESVRALTTALPFNDIKAFEKVFAENKGIAAVVIEPDGAEPPAEGFLQDLKNLTKANGALLIFDEIVTGFRVALGGAQAKHGVVPDLACFGKAMGNGMPISALCGSRDSMSVLEEVFVSGTFGGETLSLAASIATIRKLQATGCVERLWSLGDTIKDRIGQVMDSSGLSEFFKIGGPSWRPFIAPVGDLDPILAVTLLRQELIQKGTLIGSSFNLCLAHDDVCTVDDTVDRWERAAIVAVEALASSNPISALRGELVEPVFQVRK